VERVPDGPWPRDWAAVHPSTLVIVLEREGRTPEAMVLYSREGIRETARFPGGEMPTFHPAPEEAIKALMGSVSVDSEPSNGVALGVHLEVRLQGLG